MLHFLFPPFLRLESEGIDLLMNLLLVSGRAAQVAAEGLWWSEVLPAAFMLISEPGRRGAASAA